MGVCPWVYFLSTMLCNPLIESLIILWYNLSSFPIWGRVMNTAVRYFLASVSAIILVGCDGGGSSSGGGGDNTPQVRFEVSQEKGPICYNHTKRSKYQTEDKSYTSISCTWYCANYKNYRHAYVSITFVNSKYNGRKWVKDREYISEDGIC